MSREAVSEGLVDKSAMDDENIKFVRERIREFWLKNTNKPKTFTVKHFTDEGFSARFVYKIVKMMVNGESLDPIKKTGRPKISLTKKQINNLKKKCHGRVCPSLGTLGALLNVSKPTAGRLAEEHGLVKIKKN